VSGSLDGEPGSKASAIAQDLGVHRTTVRLWLKHYHERGVEGLQIPWAPGQPGRIPETLAPTIQEWVKAGPEGVADAMIKALDFNRHYRV
jgi:transposase